MNIEGSGCGELQQLVQEEEGEEPPSRGAEATPPSTPAKSNRQSKTDSHNIHTSQQVLWENNTQVSPMVSKGSSGHATTSQGSMVSGRAMQNSSNQTTNQSRLLYLNEKEKQKPSRPEPPRTNRQHREVPDVRRMEQALLHLLEDFHSGNLRAFGKDCSMEQMTEIREQQERLARLHFELGQRQEGGAGSSGEQSGLRQSSANMRHLLHRLQQLSVCIEKLHRLFQEPTTYRHDFTSYPLPLQAAGELAKRHPVVDFAEANHSKLLKTITSHDTLQQLDYESRLPFNAMLRPKDIVGTDPRQTFCKRIIEDEGLEEAIKTRPRQYVSPAISLDNVEDKNTRKLMVDFTYMTTTSQAGKEAWSGFCPNEPSLPNTVFEKTVDPLALRLKLLPDIPAGFKISAKKWDSIQERYRINDTAQILKSRRNIHYEKRLTNLVTAEEKDEVRNLIKKNKLRLPYDKMPLSYGGFRPLFAIKVPLEVKESSPFDPNLSVSKAVTARLSASLRP